MMSYCGHPFALCTQGYCKFKVRSLDTKQERKADEGESGRERDGEEAKGRTKLG